MPTPPSDADSNDEEESDLNREMIKLLQLMPQFYPADAEENEEFGLRHEDISRRKIVVDPYTGELTALLDWECVSFVPL